MEEGSKNVHMPPSQASSSAPPPPPERKQQQQQGEGGAIDHVQPPIPISLEPGEGGEEEGEGHLSSSQSAPSPALHQGQGQDLKITNDVAPPPHHAPPLMSVKACSWGQEALRELSAEERVIIEGSV
jgi:hypothetical protein